jgi:hypothetical protein
MLTSYSSSSATSTTTPAVTTPPNINTKPQQSPQQSPQQPVVANPSLARRISQQLMASPQSTQNFSSQHFGENSNNTKNNKNKNIEKKNSFLPNSTNPILEDIVDEEQVIHGYEYLVVVPWYDISPTSVMKYTHFIEYYTKLLAQLETTTIQELWLKDLKALEQNLGI